MTRGRRSSTVIVGLALAASALVVVAPVAAAAVPVDDYDDLANAVDDCASDTVVTVTADIPAGRNDLLVGCDVTVDLATWDVTLASVTIDTGHELVLRDSTAGQGEPGRLEVSARGEDAGVGNTGAALVVDGRAVVSAIGGPDGGAGIGGDNGEDGGSTIVIGSAVVDAAGGSNAAGIGGGDGGDGGTTTALSGARITAEGGDDAAGIGGGGGVGDRGGETTAGGRAVIEATGGDGGAGIGGGTLGAGGETTAGGTSRIVATGGSDAAGVGGGANGGGGETTVLDSATIVARGGTDGGAGVGSGFQPGAADGPTTVVDGTPGAPARLIALVDDSAPQDQGSPVGDGGGGRTFGTLRIEHGILTLPGGSLRAPASGAPDGREITLGEGGVIESKELDDDFDPTDEPGTGELTGDGRIDNGGAITLRDTAVAETLEVLDHDYDVSFDTNAADAVLAPGTTTTRVRAATFDDAEREDAFPDPPTRRGFRFAGWNSEPDSSGVAITATSELPPPDADGTPAEVTAYAQWRRPTTPPRPPVAEPLPPVSTVIDGRPRVGDRLVAEAALGDEADGTAPEDVTYSYQWLRDGAPIDGATQRRYRPTRADVAREVTVRVTASKNGRADSSDTARSVVVAPVVGIKGRPRVGQELGARVFVPAGARPTYQWQRSPRPEPGTVRTWRSIRGATDTAYVLRPWDARHRVRLVVVISGPDLSDVRSVSRGRYVARAPRTGPGR